MKPPPGYAAGNILNMLAHLGADLTGYDFSGLPVWGAYAQGIELQRVNFAGADIAKSAFTKTLIQRREIYVTTQPRWTDVW